MFDHEYAIENFDRLWVLYFDEETLSEEESFLYPPLVLAGRVSQSKHGVNSLLVEASSVWVDQVLTGQCTHTFSEHLDFEPQRLTGAQRKVNDRVNLELDRVVPGIARSGLKPIIYCVEAGDEVRCYMAVEATARHLLALRFCTVAYPPGEHDYQAVQAIVARARASLIERLPLLNSRFGYFQWRPEMEFERKFTFQDLPDTWNLVTDLYARLYGGALPGFFPECHKGFQVFDYENHIFDIVGEPEELGYISFIPQVNSKVTVKRKWFQENAELRRESLWWDQNIGGGDLAAEARSRVNADILPLPVFRRKRFDVNFESLKTGHVYGVYFDICRTVDAPAEHSFGQVEVEYCRSRTAFLLDDIFEEFNYLAKYVERLLSEKKVAYKEDLFSKLDFSRQSRSKNNIPE
ncbi:hypothetical protein HDC30_004870 [Pseudomonas sp. JAI115]|uniref:hypothetical protein n=1 Tax=Pseudomonas sp. JAI115 TaxID=2723061 RepID=UPI00160D8987|nr:hypothetical protein [Pseudomonas sp. JAI115]MBB6157619.1 hypothetical protein [Pseudomonas sp. JAI115]